MRDFYNAVITEIKNSDTSDNVIEALQKDAQKNKSDKAFENYVPTTNEDNQ